MHLIDITEWPDRGWLALAFARAEQSTVVYRPSQIAWLGNPVNEQARWRC